MTSTSALPLAAKSYLVTAISDLLADDTEGVLVLNGHPGPSQPNDIVSFGRFQITEQPGPISTRRTRHVTLKLYVTISIARGGGREAEDAAEVRCLDLADQIGEYVRVTDTTLGGLVLWCFRTGYDSTGSTDPQLLAGGRVIEATVELTAEARITTQ